MSIAGIYEGGKVTIPFVTPTSIVSNTPTFGQDSISLRRYVSRRGKTQRWEIRTNLMPTNNDANFLIHSVTNNASKVFDILMPQVRLSEPSSYTGTILVESSVPTGSLSVGILIDNESATIAKGEFIQFSTHDKIYVVTETLTGSGILKIFPELRFPIDDSTVVKYRNSGPVLFRGYYDLDVVFGIQFVDGILSDPGTVTFIEAT
jgi:hypothetical protein